MGRGMAMHVLLVLSCVCVSVLAQYGEGPLPPRLQIPGAIPAPGPGPGPGPQRPRVAVRQRRPQQQARQQAYLPTPPNDLDDGPTPRPPPILAQARPAPLPTTLPPRPVEEEPEEYDDDEETAAPPSTLTPTTAVVFNAPQQPIFRTSRPPQPSPTPSVFAAPQQPIFRTARPPQIRLQDPPTQFRQQAQPARPAARPVIQLTSPVGVTVGDIPVSPNRQQFRQQSPPRPAAFRPERPIIPEPPRQQQLVRQQEDGPRQQQSPRPAAFRPERPAIPEPPRPQIVRQQEESPRQQQRQPSRPTPVAIDDDDEEIPDVPRQQFRQQPRPSPQAAPQQFVRQQQKQPQPQQKQQQAYSPYKPPRDRKPVAQVLRKYRDDNPDGSITWGYENDDGSFKEETIGVDCIVSGKYGYVDPDGMRREYTYSSGIPCDKNKEEEEEKEKGYMDYQNNAFVLPNGQSIDLQSFNNHKSRRPVAG